MDVVEAIDTWIDNTIDDLSDDELERILELLDAVADSRYAELDVEELYDDDIEDIASLAADDGADREFAEAVLRSALLDEPLDELDDASLGDEEPSLGDDDTSPEDEDAAEDHGDGHRDNEAAEIGGDADIATTAAATVEALFGGDHGAADAATADRVSVDDPTREFLNDITSVLPETPPPPTSVDPVPLLPFDALGPSFLPEPVVEEAAVVERSAGNRIGRVLVPLVMIVGFGAFAFGMLQLLDSLDEPVEETSTGVGQVTVPTEVPATASPSTADDADADAAARPAPTPAPDSGRVEAEDEQESSAPPEPLRLGIRLVSGSIVLAEQVNPSEPTAVTTLYDASDEDLPASRDLTWIDAGLAVVDVDGSVYVVDAERRTPRPMLIYQSGDELPAAAQLAATGSDDVVIRTDAGDIVLASATELTEAEDLRVIWNSAEEGSAATNMATTDELIVFVTEDGTLRSANMSGRGAIAQLWTPDDEQRAFSVLAIADGVLLGLSDRTIVRLTLQGDEIDTIEQVWPLAATASDDAEDSDDSDGDTDDSDGDSDTDDSDADEAAQDETVDAPEDEEPLAAGFGVAAGDALVVLVDGSVVLIGDDQTSTVLWDGPATEIAAFDATGDPRQITVLLETGSVIRIPRDPEQQIGSIWDITDETLAPATQVIVARSG